MTALTERKLIKRRDGSLFTEPVKGGVDIKQGALVVLDAGFAAPGRTATGLRARGIARAPANNVPGVNGSISVDLEKGVYAFENDGSVLRTHIGASAYIVDDQTVAATDGGGTRSVAGEIIDLDAEGVWVKL